MRTVSEIMWAAYQLTEGMRTLKEYKNQMVSPKGRDFLEVLGAKAQTLGHAIDRFEREGPPAPSGLRPTLTPWSLAPEAIENRKRQPILLSTQQTPLRDMKIAAAAPEALKLLAEAEALLVDPRATEIDAKAILERITMLLDRVHGQ